MMPPQRFLRDFHINYNKSCLYLPRQDGNNTRSLQSPEAGMANLFVQFNRFPEQIFIPGAQRFVNLPFQSYSPEDQIDLLPDESSIAYACRRRRNGFVRHRNFFIPVRDGAFKHELHMENSRKILQYIPGLQGILNGDLPSLLLLPLQSAIH